MEHLNSGDALKSFFTEEFKTTNYGDGWLCPDISSFELYGDPSQYFEGKMIDAVVNRCDIANKTDKKNGKFIDVNLKSENRARITLNLKDKEWGLV